MRAIRVTRSELGGLIPWPTAAVVIQGERKSVLMRCVARETLNRKPNKLVQFDMSGPSDFSKPVGVCLGPTAKRLERKARRKRHMRLRLRRGRR